MGAHVCGTAGVNATTPEAELLDDMARQREAPSSTVEPPIGYPGRESEPLTFKEGSCSYTPHTTHHTPRTTHHTPHESRHTTFT